MPRRWALGFDDEDFVDASGKKVSVWQTIAGKIWSTHKNKKDDDHAGLAAVLRSEPVHELVMDRARGGAAVVVGGVARRARLDRILHQLRAGEITPDTLIDTYDRFHRTDHLHGLGPAFFTKILYFAGYRRNHGGIQPLILDSVVAGRLPDQAGPANQ